MTQICEITGKRPRVGNNVSHANNKTKRRFLPNLQTKRFYDPETGRRIKLRVCTQAMRTIDKLGINAVLDKARARKKKQ